MMRSKIRRMLMMGVLAGSGAVVFETAGAGCASFTGEQALIAADFCFIFDCQNGAFGGTVQPCNGAPGLSAGIPGHNPLLVDCPVAAGP